MEFGKRLSLLRERNGWSQVDLAQHLNISHQAISKYEGNQREPDFSTLIKIADLFKVSIDYLLNRTSNPLINDREVYEDECAFFVELQNYPNLYNALISNPKQELITIYNIWTLIRNSKS